MTTLLIDNYDSFTFNIHQYLSSQGANVVVHRNDKITIEDIVALSPTNIVISPGPGHPSHDAGISRSVISYFSGKIPILGICMGQQCIYEAFGGTVSYADTLLHGKTSIIKHDGRSLFHGVPQHTQVTRYHSLAGIPHTLPDALQVTATTEDGVIMAIRHKKYTVEGVQFHPESILCEHGQPMIANFLKLRGGTWDAAVPFEHIYAQRLQDIETAKHIPGQSQHDLEKLLALHVAPPLKDWVSHLGMFFPALIAEVKRGIDQVNAADQALQYALVGASVVSILTEPNWFRGSLHDMQQAREALSQLQHRPCILQNDFIVDRYQILEARIYGADTILLIVGFLSDDQLGDLFNYAKSLGMEPLVQVHNLEEMTRANLLGAKVIGINNMDMEETARLVETARDGTILCALSGISCRAEIENYMKQGMKGILVGESLMRAGNLKEYVDGLLGRTNQLSPTITHVNSNKKRALVKICGIRSVEEAIEAADAGADFVGLVFVTKARRCVSVDMAKDIVKAVHGSSTCMNINTISSNKDISSIDWFDLHRQLLEHRQKKPLVVGIFLNQSVEYMNYVTTAVGLDMIQLHGTEPVEIARFLPVPVIKTFLIDDDVYLPSLIPAMTQPGYHHAVLLDAKVPTLPRDKHGGLGVTFDWTLARKLTGHPRPTSADDFPIFLAGGLDATNVIKAIAYVKPWVVDVSSGVETDGRKDLIKIRSFVHLVKNTDL